MQGTNPSSKHRLASSKAVVKKDKLANFTNGAPDTEPRTQKVQILRKVRPPGYNRSTDSSLLPLKGAQSLHDPKQEQSKLTKVADLYSKSKTKAHQVGLETSREKTAENAGGSFFIKAVDEVESSYTEESFLSSIDYSQNNTSFRSSTSISEDSCESSANEVFYDFNPKYIASISSKNSLFWNKTSDNSNNNLTIFDKLSQDLPIKNLLI
jgi:hypothetical protein